MAPFLFIVGIVGIVLVAASVWIAAIILLEKLFGAERVGRYIKWRLQGPFVPTPEDNEADRRCA